ncbi:hypothetical protein [Mesorhizobium australafricanum]|uniref:Uncharacterized protein n=1 Tax=Mesorhizobium australafricanum TaxID=3072311 RepID=A0ABU4WQR3_9HYPH|nr:hypothetical protein [Mesorhizobium sp. VK3E]MDX8438374.1 hypothetical protein [Mesorhizobium sp. VK3E]
MVPLYIAAIGLAMAASAVWRYRQRDMLGMAASALMAVLAVAALLLPAKP